MWSPERGAVQTFPQLLVSDASDDSRHSFVVRSFCVAVGRSCSRDTF